MTEHKTQFTDEDYMHLQAPHAREDADEEGVAAEERRKAIEDLRGETLDLEQRVAAQQDLQGASFGPGGCVRTLEDLLGVQEPLASFDPRAEGDLVFALRTQVERSLRQHAGGERPSYTVFGSLIPGQNGQPQAVGVVVLAIPSGIDLHQKITSTSFVPNLWADEGAIDDLVVQTLAGLMDQRSQLMAQAMQQGSGQASVLRLPGS